MWESSSILDVASGEEERRRLPWGSNPHYSTMIVVDIEIHPFGDKYQKKTIKTVEIFNQGVCNVVDDLWQYGIKIDGEELEDTILHIRNSGVLVLIEKALGVINGADSSGSGRHSK